MKRRLRPSSASARSTVDRQSYIQARTMVGNAEGVDFQGSLHELVASAQPVPEVPLIVLAHGRPDVTADLWAVTSGGCASRGTAVARHAVRPCASNSRWETVRGRTERAFHPARSAGACDRGSSHGSGGRQMIALAQVRRSVKQLHQRGSSAGTIGLCSRCLYLQWEIAHDAWL
jgi:hypothetical protein